MTDAKELNMPPILWAAVVRWLDARRILDQSTQEEVDRIATRWAAEAEVGAPVADTQLVVLAVTGDIDGLRAALDLNRRWRMALAEGDRRATSDLLQEAAHLAAKS